MRADYRPIRIGLLGAGSVGSQVFKLIQEDSDELENRVGAKLEISGVLVRSLDASRDYSIPGEFLTTDAESVILGSDIVVELIGGIQPALDYIRMALESGSDVVTANKALLANHGPEIYELAERVGAQVYYEASVAGAIPIIRPLRESLAGDTVSRIMGIVNGTTNFILDQMESTGASFDAALEQAQQLGYAEADPTADVGGFDAAAKAAILSSLAFHTEVHIDDVYTEGIEKITQLDIESAKDAGYTIKLLAVCERVGDDSIAARVHPTLIPQTHPLASVRGAFNAVFVESEASGELMFYGAGAGGLETASAVLGDVVMAAKRHLGGGSTMSESSHAKLVNLPIDDIITRYQISMEVKDQPGVLAVIASMFAELEISVETLEQSTIEADGDTVLLTIITHETSERSLRNLILKLNKSDVVAEFKGQVRVEGV
jgi:homoserine dehydrogenase